MNAGVILILATVAFTLIAIGFFVLRSSFAGHQGHLKSNLKTMVSAQRRMTDSIDREAKTAVFNVADQHSVGKVMTSRLTLEKKLKYAQWKMPPAIFRLLEIAISLIALTIAHSKLNMFMQTLSLMTGPIVMRWAIGRFMDRRFRAFDADYPQFLMQLVGLLKTGMNPINGIEAASNALEPTSLVRIEVELMLERLRFGIPEDKSVGAFGEDIYHPEIELFVQALLLSRRVGGTLSDTLERLARQVRRRQYFRSSARAAIGMQRGAIWFILGIMLGLEIYLYFMFPESVIDAIADPVGWQVWQGGIALIMLGVFWINQVTKIRV